MRAGWDELTGGEQLAAIFFAFGGVIVMLLLAALAS